MKKLKEKTTAPTNVAALFGADLTPAEHRDKASLLLLATGGLRSVEVCRLQNIDYHPDNGELEVRGKDFRVYKRLTLIGNAKEAVESWLNVRGSRFGYMFCRVGSGTVISPEVPILSATLWWSLKNRLRKAGIESSLTPREMRRACLVEMLSNSRSVAEARLYVGAAHLGTVENYVPMDDLSAEFTLPTLPILPPKKRA